MTISLDKNSPPMSNPNDIMGMKPNTFCMLLHLSQLLMFAMPVLGIAVPIILWAINRDKYPIVDQHGKIILNWLISCIIYMLASIVLMFLGIGVITVLIVVAASVVFPIIGGLKANDGIVWEYKVFNYAASIKFLK